MSITRQFRRALYRKAGKPWLAAPVPFRVHKDEHGYDALHATKGWRRFSAKRLRAQARLREIYERLSVRAQ